MNSNGPRHRLRLCEIGEDGWLERLAKSLGPTAKEIAVGFGDDAACLVIPAGGQTLLLITTDVLVEATHFTWQTATPATLGEKAVAVNVSDIAAMGGRPTAMVVGLGAPPNCELARLASIYRGMQKACRRWGIAFVGGDTVKSDKLILSPTLLGEFDGPREKLPLRNRLRQGQDLYVTGTLGDSAAGMMVLMAGRKKPPPLRLSECDRRHLSERHRRPQPRLREGQLLARHLDDLAMIDLSDDLHKSVGLLCKASGVGATVDVQCLPVSAALRNWSRATKISLKQTAVYGGEAYELLFATAAAPHTIQDLFRRHGLRTPVTAIGRVGGRTVRWQNFTPSPVDFRLMPYEHFSS
ncbi:MAG: thiamine-phosphate kinase [Candidatus Sumerlaeia bacterium]|nr:thiamine-phosphate kinase [Candidatus Sumerlaeia bacterium]